MNAKAYETYQQQGVLTAGPAGLIVMLYDEAIKQLKLGGMSIDSKDYEQANQHFQKVRRVFLELINSLDFHFELSNDLLKLYEFFIRQTMAMNASKDKTELERLVGMLTDLRLTWSSVAKSFRNGGME